MKYSNTIEYNISTKLDSKGLTQLKAQLQQLELSLQKMGNQHLLDEKQFSDARDQIKGLRDALTEAYDPSLGLINFKQLNKLLQDNGVSAQGLKTAFQNLGAEGQVAFNNLTKQLGQLDTGIKRSNSQIDKLFTTFSNTFRWGLVSSFFSNFMNGIHSSIQYVHELDDSLTQIMLVTDYNRDAMNEYAKSANEAAKAVSMSTVGMTNASLVFAQQGYDLGQSQELATLSAKLANASQQDTATTSDQITAYMNAYGLENSIEELTQQMDNWALIANVSAADVAELAEASQRAASMANAVGVSGEQLAAQIATIESVTREAPEQIGNGLKTLYARFSDIASGKEDEDGFTLGKVTSELNKIGVQVLDSMGQIRDVGDIMEDLMVIWDDLDQTSKVASAQALAGKYQVNRFMALMDNTDMYQEYKGATGDAAIGTLDQMNQEFADSLAGRTQKLQTTLESLFNDVLTTDVVYPLIDVLTKLTDTFDSLFKAVGGGVPVLTGLLSVFGRLFSNNLAAQITESSMNAKVQKIRQENYKHSGAALQQLGAINPNSNDANSQALLDFAKQSNAMAPHLNEGQMATVNSILEKMTTNANAATLAQQKLSDELTKFNTEVSSATNLGKAFATVFIDDFGAINASELLEFTKGIKDLTPYLAGSAENIKILSNSLEECNNAFIEMQEVLRTSDNAFDDCEVSIDVLQQQFKALENTLPTDVFKNLTDGLDLQKLQDAFAKGNLEEYPEKIQQISTKFAHFIELLKEMPSQDLNSEGFQKWLDDLQRVAAGAEVAQQATDDAIREAQAVLDGFSTQAMTRQIIDIVSASGQLLYSFQAIKNLGSIWSNEDISGGEKLFQTFLSLSTIIPQVFTAVQAFGKGLEFLAEKQNAQIALNAAQEKGELEAARSKEASAKAIENQMRATLNAAKAQEAKTKSDLDAAQASLAEAQAELAQAEAMDTLTQSTIQQIKAEAMQNHDTATLATALQLEQQLVTNKINKAKAQQKVNAATEKVTKAEQEHEKAVKGVQEAENNLAKASQAASAATAGLEVATKAYNLATGKAVTSTDLLVKAFNFLKTHPVILALSVAAAALGAIFLHTEEQAKKAREAALEAYEEAKSKLDEIKNLTSQMSAFGDKYDIFKESGEGGEELAEEAEKVAESMKEAGYESNALEVHLAAVKAEATGTAEAYENLAKTIDEQTLKASDDANIDIINTGSETLRLNDTSVDKIIEKEQRVKELREDIAKLDPFADDYEQQKSALETMVAVNEKWLSDNKEQVEIVHQMTEAYASMSGIQLGLQQFGAGSDTGALLNFFSDNIEGFDKLRYIDQLGMALQYVTDDAQRAALEVEQLLQNNDNVANGEVFVRGEGNVDALSMTRSLLNESGFTSDQQIKILASLDEDASYKEIKNKIEDIQQRMENDGNTFNMALNPTDPEKAKKMTLSEFESMDTSGLDSDVDAKEFSNLGTYLAQTAEAAEDLPEYLAYDADALADFTEAILRYDDAIETATDKMDDWEDTLINARKNSQKMASVTKELAETYSDLLDLDPDSILGLDFTGSIDNLEDLKLAIEGDEDAYKRLQQAAMKEITPNIDLSSLNPENFQLATDALASMGIEASNTVDIMSQAAAALDGMDWEVNPVLDDGDFIAGLNNLIASGAMTSEQVQQSLAAMGYDVELEPVQEEVENPSTAYGMVASIEPKKWTGTTPLPGAGGSALANGTVIGMPSTASIEGTVPTIHYTAEPLDTTSIETKAGVGMKITTGGGQTSGGNTQVKSIKKKADGGQKSGHSTHGGGGGTGGGGGGKGGGKGGGGGSGKTYTPKTKEKVKYDTDRYEKVNTELSKIKEVLEGIEKETERLYGDDARANVNKRITLLGQEIDLEREKLRIQKEENAEVKKQLTDKGVTFDSNGFISNYNEIIKSYEKRINDLTDKYNKATTETEQKRIEKEIEALQKEYETVKKGMDRYDELQSEIEATTNNIKALKDAIEDLAIAAYQASMDAIDNLKELNELSAKLDGFWSGYEIDSPFRKIIEDESLLDNMFESSEEQMDAMRDKYQDMADAASKAAEEATDPYEKATQRLKAEYFQDQANKVGENGLGAGTLDMRLQQLQDLQRWMNDPTAEDNPFGDNTAALYEAYEETYKALGNDILEAEEAAEQLQQDILDGYADIADKQKENLEDFDRINDRLEHYSKMYELINGPDHFKETAELINNMMNNTLASLQQAQKNLNYWTAKYQEAIDKGLTKEAAQFKEEMINAQKEVWERSEQYAQQAFDKISNLVKQQNADLVQSLLGNDMESLTRDWERDKEYANKYLDTVQRTYETEKLRSKYLDLLDSAQNTSLATQNKIRQAMNDQVKYMEDQVYLSEYNVKYANARLDVLQKQIALENAQQNKNQMKLKRDSQGNYKYVYSANEGDVREAQQDLLDSEFNAYDMSKDNMMQNQDEALALIRRFTEQRLEIFENYYGDSQKIQEELQKLTEDTQRDLAALGEEYEDSFFGMIESVSWMADSGVESFNNMATEVLESLKTKSFDALEQMGIYVNDAIDGVLTAINDNLPAFDNSMNDTLTVVATFHTEIDTMSEAIGEDFTDINDVMRETTQQTNDLKEATLALNEALAAEDQKLQAAQAKLAEYEEKLQNSKDKTSALRSALQQARAEAEAKTQEARNYKTVATKELKKGEDFIIPAGTKIYYAKNASQTDTSGNNYMTFDTDKKVTIRELNKDSEYGVGVFPSDQKNPIDMENGIADPEKEDTGKDKGRGRRNKQMWWVDPNLARVQILASMDTGGYTGDWSEGLGSKNGRLALLHQKELVLNAADTQNILQAVEVMRDAVKLQQLSGLTSAAMLNLTTKSASGGDTIEQRVEITATFPNVNTASEIEQALLNLSDQAYQYSHRMI